MGFEPRTLGKTNLVVSPLGIGGGYGVDGNSIEWAFEHGINYFFWAPWVPTYRPMERGLRSLLPRHRDEIVIATAAYFWLFPASIERAVKNTFADSTSITSICFCSDGSCANLSRGPLMSLYE
jgi:aryl-alcohol dehydrogenase-like predicted oxidoreductase